MTYDAIGRMVEKNVSGTYTQIAYSPQGGKLAVMNGQTLQKAFVPLPRGGTAVYTGSGLSYYRHPDWLGSSPMATTPSRTLYASDAYAPFGESYAQAGTADLSFAGHDQDTVSGTYDAVFRRYDPAQGRWISPDPAGINSVDLGNPQTWNRYGYVRNNPLSLIDPLGLGGCDASGNCTATGAAPCPDGSYSMNGKCIDKPGDPTPACNVGEMTVSYGGAKFCVPQSAAQYIATQLSGQLPTQLCPAGQNCGQASGSAANNGTQQTPKPVTPDRTQRFNSCFQSCVTQTFDQNTNDFIQGEKKAPVRGAEVGVGTCTAVVISEPYLAPAWPACTVATTASTTLLLGGLSLTEFVVRQPTSVAGCAYYCAKNSK